MGCCTSLPKPRRADNEPPKNFDDGLDPEESEHGGFVNTAAIAKLSQKAVATEQANKKPEVNGAAAHVDHARVMSLEGNQRTIPIETTKRHASTEKATQLENSTILGRASQHKRNSFFHVSFKGDPFHILSFLSDYDLARLTQVNRQMHGLVEGFISIRHAKQESRADWTEKEWTKLRLGSRDGGSQWIKLRHKLAKEPNVNVKEELIDELTPALFRDKYEARSMPCLIRGCAQDWKAFASTTVWTLDSLASRFPTTMFRFNDLHGEEILLKDYLMYARSTDDDSPLGLYDSQVGVETNDPRAVMLTEYKVPPIFGEDLFALMSDDDARPPFRWVLLGVPRSGTEMHIDPLETSAWVTVLSGRKKWCLFPPSSDDKLLGGVHALARNEDENNPVVSTVSGGKTIKGKKQYSPTACEWFATYYGTPATQIDGAVTLTQGPGDTVFIPGGWKHIVINLEETVAITHNYAPKENLDRIRKSVQATEPEFYSRWEAKLKEQKLI